MSEKMKVPNFVGVCVLLTSLCVVGLNCFHARYSGDKEVDEGEDFTIKCIIDNIDDLKWTKDGKAINSEDGYSFKEEIEKDSVIAKLHVSSASEKHEGDYRCNRFSRDFHSVKVGDEDKDKDDRHDDSTDALKMNSTIELYCDLENVAGMEISWYKDWMKIIDENSDDVNIDGRKLTVRNADEGDSGTYMCKIEIVEDDKKPDVVGRAFEIKSEPGLRNFPRIWSVKNGNDLELKCDVYGGYPTPVIRWFIGNEAAEDIQKKDRRIQMLKTGKYPKSTFHISGVTYSDRNLYTCEVSNSIAKKETSTLVTIRVAESNLLPSSTTYVKQGDKFVLSCKVPITGLHLWLKDGVPISASPANRYRFEQEQAYSENRGYYITMKLTVDVADVIHSGEYKCNSFSPHSQVIVVLSENMIKTNEEESGKGLLLAPKSDLVLQCNTTECEHCNVEWRKDGDILDTSNNRIHIYNENNSLIITDATEKDTGNYMCIVDKQVITHEINTTIAVRTKTEIKQFPKSIHSLQGDKLTLYCNVTSGRPIPTIVWYKDGQLLNDSDNHIKISDDDERGIKDSYLIIEELEFADRAYYTCEADNVVNCMNTTVLIRVKDKLAALWPFLGICAEVAILCTIILVYEKRKVKESDESDTDNNPESKSIPEGGRSQDIRQRK